MYALGIDIGGTSIKGALLNDKAETKEMFSLPIDKSLNQEETILKLIDVIKDYLAKQDIKEDILGIGIGIPGTINVKDGIVIFSGNLGWKDFHIVEFMKRHLPYDVKITNDANAAAYGEAIFGAGKKYHNVIMLTLGTGVGGGVVINDKLFEGSDGTGTELGHMIIHDNGVPCSCGLKGCYEAYASATALIRMSKEKMDKYPSSLMHDIALKEGKVNGKVAFEASKLGDIPALEVVEEYARNVALGIVNYSNIFRPDCFVLSGGIANQGDYLIDKINKYYKEYNYGFPNAKRADILVAELGYMSGIIGAGALWFK